MRVSEERMFAQTLGEEPQPGVYASLCCACELPKRESVEEPTPAAGDAPRADCATPKDGHETEPTKEGELQGTREENTAPALGIASGGLSPTGRQLMSQSDVNCAVRPRD